MNTMTEATNMHNSTQVNTVNKCNAPIQLPPQRAVGHVDLHRCLRHRSCELLCRVYTLASTNNDTKPRHAVRRRPLHMANACQR